MPTRIPLPRRTPPSLTDRLNAHAEAFCVVGMFWTYAGAVALLFNPAKVLPHVGAGAAWSLAVMLTVGGLCVLAAVIWPGADSTSWTLEALGYALGGWAWFANTVGESDPFFAGIGAAFVVLALWRVVYHVVMREIYHRRQTKPRTRVRLQE